MTRKEAEKYLQTIPEDEPVFVMRAQDKVAPAVVMMWANCADFAGAPQEKVDGACQQAVIMSGWQRDNPNTVKVPD